MPVTDIALSSGYEGPESFARAFRKQTGQSPSEFRREPQWDPWTAVCQPLSDLRIQHMTPTYSRDQVRIVDFPATRVAALEHRGDPRRLGASIRRFIEWRKANRLPPRLSDTFNIAYDDPEQTPAEDFRFDLCAATERDIEPNDNGVVAKTIPAGRCAVIRHIGSDDLLVTTVAFLYAEWLPVSGEEPRDFPLYFQRVSFSPTCRNMRRSRMYSCRSDKLSCTWAIALALALSRALSGCSGGAPEGSNETPPDSSAQDGGDAGSAPASDLEPGDIPIQLVGSLQFTSEEQLKEGTDQQGQKYSRHFSAQCNFKQPAVMWTNPETERLEFRLREAEPGVLKSDFTGGAEATGDSRVADLIHTPSVLETSTVRLRGPLTECLIRRLDPAEFGSAQMPGHDITIEFQTEMTGTVQTHHTSGDGSSEIRKSGGYALPLVLEGRAGEQEQFSLVNDPSNTGAHLHASPLQMRPALGERPAGDDPEIKLKQDVYDSIAKQPETAWLGLVFDPAKKIWTFTGSHITGARSKHTLNVTIQAVDARSPQ